MNKSPFRLIVIVALPLLVFGSYLTFSTVSSDVEIDEAFVHPPITGQNNAGAEMLRSQGGTTRPSVPTTAPSRDNVTDAYYHQIFILEEKLKGNAADTLSMRELGRLYQDGHLYPGAEAQYVTYLSTQPRAKQVWLDLATVYAGQNEWTEARSTIVSMLQIYPNDATGRYNMGAIAANSGDLSVARDIWSDLASTSSDATVKTMAAASLSRLAGNE